MAMQPASKCLDEATLGALVSGRLDGARLTNAEVHLADCGTCRRALSECALATGLTMDSQISRRAHEATASDEHPKSASFGDPATGTVIDGRYRVDDLLGRGGMGSVVAATHLGLQQRVAIKVLKLAGTQAVARFLREGRTLAQLNNPHIVRVYDSGELPSGVPYIVMELLEGSDLAQLIGRGPIALGDAVSYVRQACAALEAAHGAGFVHRDLKPSNLFLVGQAGAPLVKVLDFGISKSLQVSSGAADTALTLTGTGDVIGSPRYMSPEQLQGRRELDARTDIWSLGVILYELLGGKAPFPQRDFAAVAIAIATERPAALRALRSDIPEALQAIVMRCLQKDPSQRFQSVTALAHALLPYDPRLNASGELPRSKRWPLKVAGAALLVAAAGVWLARNAFHHDAAVPAPQHSRSAVAVPPEMTPAIPPAAAEDDAVKALVVSPVVTPAPVEAASQPPVAEKPSADTPTLNHKPAAKAKLAPRTVPKQEEKSEHSTLPGLSLTPD